MKKGLLIILSGPSGVGKGTLRKEIVKDTSLNLGYSISMTTREPREGEKDGVDYYFVKEDDFLRDIEDDNFLEYAKFVGHYYGTPKYKVDEMRNKGINVILEIEINGAKQVMSKVKDDGVISFFLMPPNFEALENRIRNRRTEPEDVIQERLNKGRKEMTMTESYDYIIINDDLIRAANEIKSIISNKIKEMK